MTYREPVCVCGDSFAESSVVDLQNRCRAAGRPEPKIDGDVVSLILPYWKRQEAATKALKSIEKHYSGMKNLEIVLVDDVSDEPFVPPDVDLYLRVIHVPLHLGRGSLSRTLNIGVANSTGRRIILSMSEVIHEEPVIESLLDSLNSPNDYALAAAWCPEQDAWHCHSSLEPPFTPNGTGFAWLGAMTRELYDRAGGFDEDYQDGKGNSPFEDCDFVRRMVKAGANFIHRDDLIVIHPKTGATVDVPVEAFVRNEKLYYSKWPYEQYPTRLRGLYTPF